MDAAALLATASASPARGLYYSILYPVTLKYSVLYHNVLYQC